MLKMIKVLCIYEKYIEWNYFKVQMNIFIEMC